MKIPWWETGMQKLYHQLWTLTELTDLDTGNRFTNEKVVLTLLTNKTLIDSLTSLLDKYEDESAHILSKNPEKAEISRSEGNKYYINGNNEKAISCYNESIRNCCVQNNRQSLALAYANRSAVFFNQNAFSKCLTDIDMALNLSYPEDLRHKLFKRKAECFMKLSRWSDAKDALEKTKSAINTIPSNMRPKYVSAIRSLENAILDETSKYQNPTHACGSMNKRQQVKDILDLKYGVKSILNASAGMELKYNSTAGRHFIAKKPFKCGDRVISEKPFVSVLSPEFYSTHCHHCLSMTDAIIPCVSCNLICYCSVKCQKESWQQYHSKECNYLLLLNEIGISHLALRIILKCSIFELFDEHFQQVDCKVDDKFPLGNLKDRYCNDYKAVYNLVSHANECPNEKRLQYDLNALVLFLILQRAKYFDNQPDFDNLERKINFSYLNSKEISKSFDLLKENGNCVSSVQVFIGSLLVHHIHQVACNAIAITGLSDIQTSSTSDIIEYKQKRLATAIYPTAVLLNHSCDATSILTFNADTLNVKVTRDVNPGEEISISYGPHYKKMNVQNRIDCLKEQYYFCCSCLSCKNGLGIDGYCNNYKCFDCEAAIQDLRKGTCPSCSKNFDPQYYESLYESSMVHFRESSDPSIADKPEIVLKHLKKCLEVQSEIFHQHHRQLASLHNAIAACLAKQQRYFSSKLHFEKCLEITTHIYGENSTEVGYELLTLSDLMIKIIHSDVASCNETGTKPNFDQIEKCFHTVQRAMKILRHLCDDSSDELTDLMEKSKYLSNLLICK